METIVYGKIPDSWFGSHFDLEWPLLHHESSWVMWLVFQKVLLVQTNILIPNTHPYVWSQLSYEYFRMSFLPLYLSFWPFWGLFAYFGVFRTNAKLGLKTENWLWYPSYSDLAPSSYSKTVGKPLLPQNTWNSLNKALSQISVLTITIYL